MRTGVDGMLSRLVGAAAVVFAVHLAPAAAQVTARVSVDSAGIQGDGSSWFSSVSADGRFVAFTSEATDLVAGDTNLRNDIFVRDLQLGTTVRVSVGAGGAQGNDESYYPSISADGRYVAFYSHSSNLVPGDTNSHSDVFVHDRQLGTTERVSLSTGGGQAGSLNEHPSISADGRYVAFGSPADNLVPGDTNFWTDVFVRDRQLGTTERVSVDSSGAQCNGSSDYPSISADGRYVVFHSHSTNLVAGDTNGVFDIFVRDRQLGTTERVSVDSGGAQGNSDSDSPSISADGRYIAFHSFASNLVAGDTNAREDIFVRDRQAGATERASVGAGGVQGNFASVSPWISADGRYVEFASFATNLVAGDTNSREDIFLRDRQLGATERVSVDSAGIQGNGHSYSGGISSDGRIVAFMSESTNLVPGDSNARTDVFVRDRVPPPMESLCDPGVAGVAGCPCSNPPSGSGRGCDNSANTGGASLQTAGDPDLSADTLSFTTSGQIPATLSILVQGDALAASGQVYGRGVRCAGGVLRTLYAKTAAGGGITAPDSGAGDPTVSARSAALGDTLAGGQTRWYFVAYRDPIAFCPAPFAMAGKQTFNATQTWRILWRP